MKRIIGIDPGTARVGWGVLESSSGQTDKAVCLGYGVIETDKTMTDSQRLLAIANGIEHLIDQYKPETMAIEKLFLFKNQKTVMTVSQARGVIMYVAERQRVGVLEYTPLEVKQTLTGYGRAEKEQMQKMVQLLLRLPQLPKPDDAADAVAIALTGLQRGAWAKL